MRPQSVKTLCRSCSRAAFCAAVFPACKVATHFVLLFSLLVKLHCTLCCCCLSLQSCNAFCAAIFPARKDAEQFSLLFSPACKVAMQVSLQSAKLRCIFCCFFPCLQSCNAEQSAGIRCILHLRMHMTHMFQNCFRQCSHAMGDGECKAAAGMGHRSPLHHCPATAPRGCSVLAGVQPDSPCPSEMCFIPSFVSCYSLSLFTVIVVCHFLSLLRAISCHCCVPFPVFVACHLLSLSVMECATSTRCICVMHNCIDSSVAIALP